LAGRITMRPDYWAGIYVQYSVINWKVTAIYIRPKYSIVISYITFSIEYNNISINIFLQVTIDIEFSSQISIYYYM